jgi:hypothetical protein
VNVEPEGYLTTAEVMKRLKWSARTMRAKIADGVFREGQHFFQPAGCQRRWKWSAVAAWLEGKERPVIDDQESIRLAHGGGKELL